MKKLNGTATWILVFIALAALTYKSISVQAVAMNDIKYIQSDIKEIKEILFKYVIPGPDDIIVTKRPG